MSEGTKKLFKVAIALVLALLLVWLALFTIIATDGFRENVVAAINSFWRGKVVIGSISLQFPATIVIEKFTLQQAGGGAAWVALRKGRISPSWSALFSRAGEVSLEGLSLRLRQRGPILEPLNLIGPNRRAVPRGQSVYRTPPPAGAKLVFGDEIARALVTLPIEKLTVLDGTLSLEQADPTFKVKFPIKNITGAFSYDHKAGKADLSFKGKSSLGGELKVVGEGTVTNSSSPQFTGQLSLENGQLDLGRIPKMLGKEMAEFLGKISGLCSLRLNGQFLGTSLQGLQANLQAKELDVPLPLGNLISQSISASIVADERSRRLDGILEAAGLRLTGAATTENSAGQSLRLEVRRDGVILRIDKLESMSHSGQISGTGFFSIGAGSIFSIMVGGFPAYEIELIGASCDLGESALTAADGSSRTVRVTADRFKARLVPGALEVTELDLLAGSEQVKLSGTLTLQMGGMVEGTLASTPEHAYDAFISGLLWAPNVQLTPKAYGNQEGQ